MTIALNIQYMRSTQRLYKFKLNTVMAIIHINIHEVSYFNTEAAKLIDNT